MPNENQPMEDEKTATSELCPECHRLGRISHLTFQRINLNEALLICKSKNCTFPFDKEDVMPYIQHCHPVAKPGRLKLSSSKNLNSTKLLNRNFCEDTTLHHQLPLKQVTGDESDTIVNQKVTTSEKIGCIVESNVKTSLVSKVSKTFPNSLVSCSESEAFADDDLFLQVDQNDESLKNNNFHVELLESFLGEYESNSCSEPDSSICSSPFASDKLSSVTNSERNLLTPDLLKYSCKEHVSVVDTKCEGTAECSQSVTDVSKTSTQEAQLSLLKVPLRNQNLQQWLNDKNSCWLDVLIHCLVHSTCVRIALNHDMVLHNTASVMFRLCQSYDSAQCQFLNNLLEDLEKIRQKLDLVQKLLNEARSNVFSLLQQSCSLETGSFESVIEMLPSLLKLDPNVNDVFTASYRWEIQCNSCCHKSILRNSSVCISLPSTTADFHPLHAKYLRSCQMCKADDQTMHLTFEKLPPCLIIHFQRGLPHNFFQLFDFGIQGSIYAVVAVIQYLTTPCKHFVLWIRDNRRHQWMRLDDLKEPECTWQLESPNIPPDQIHAVMWERQGLSFNETDSLTQLEPLVLNLPLRFGPYEEDATRFEPVVLSSDDEVGMDKPIPCDVEEIVSDTSLPTLPQEAESKRKTPPLFENRARKIRISSSDSEDLKSLQSASNLEKKNRNFIDSDSEGTEFLLSDQDENSEKDEKNFGNGTVATPDSASTKDVRDVTLLALLEEDLALSDSDDDNLVSSELHGTANNLPTESKASREESSVSKVVSLPSIFSFAKKSESDSSSDSASSGIGDWSLSSRSFESPVSSNTGKIVVDSFEKLGIDCPKSEPETMSNVQHDSNSSFAIQTSSDSQKSNEELCSLSLKNKSQRLERENNNKADSTPLCENNTSEISSQIASSDSEDVSSLRRPSNLVLEDRIFSSSDSEGFDFETFLDETKSSKEIERNETDFQADTSQADITSDSSTSLPLQYNTKKEGILIPSNWPKPSLSPVVVLVDCMKQKKVISIQNELKYSELNKEKSDSSSDDEHWSLNLAPPTTIRTACGESQQQQRENDKSSHEKSTQPPSTTHNLAFSEQEQKSSLLPPHFSIENQNSTSIVRDRQEDSDTDSDKPISKRTRLSTAKTARSFKTEALSESDFFSFCSVKTSADFATNTYTDISLPSVKEDKEEKLEFIKGDFVNPLCRLYRLADENRRTQLSVLPLQVVNSPLAIDNTVIGKKSSSLSHTTSEDLTATDNNPSGDDWDISSSESDISDESDEWLPSNVKRKRKANFDLRSSEPSKRCVRFIHLQHKSYPVSKRLLGSGDKFEMYKPKNGGLLEPKAKNQPSVKNKRCDVTNHKLSLSNDFARFTRDDADSGCGDCSSVTSSVVTDSHLLSAEAVPAFKAAKKARSPKAITKPSKYTSHFISLSSDLDQPMEDLESWLESIVSSPSNLLS